MKADYSAAKTGRFRRRRNVPVMGAGADYHYRTETDFLRIMEYARDMERNDAIVGPLVDQALNNIIQGGLNPDPKTGDDGVNTEIKNRWSEWCGGEDKASPCSIDGELSYVDMEYLALRRMIVDGDCFPLLLKEGQIEIMEGHRCRTPQRTQKNVVHGVLMDDRRRRLQYWFTKEDISPLSAVTRVTDISARDAFDADGYRNVLHLRNPHRVTQTRGLSAFTPIFDLVGMHEDLHFAKLVQQQVASCIAIIRERSADWKAGGIEPYGNQTQEVFDAAKRLVEEISPGMELRGLPGETVKGFSPNIPNAEFFQQLRTVLQLVGVNIGMPLVLFMMDASDTNFSGWRGAMDAARMGFKRVQQRLVDHHECPIYCWKLRQWAKEDAALRKIMPAEIGGGAKTRTAATLFKHEWQVPRWQYIQPLQDAQADELQQRRLLASPRRLHSAKGGDWVQSIGETVEDNAMAIEKAATAAKELSQKIGQPVTWREVLFLTDVEMLKATTASSGPQAGQSVAEGNDSEANTIGVYVRAGVITPQLLDEEHARKKLGLPEMSSEAKNAWSKDGGVRRPITLTASDGSHPSAAAASTQNQDPEGGKDKADPEDDPQDPEDKEPT